MQIPVKILFVLLSVLMLFACRDKKKKLGALDDDNVSKTIDSVQIMHQVLPTMIPVSGFPDYWKKVTILADDTSQIISLLVEEDQKVPRNAHLLSLWHQYRSRDFTPLDIWAPFEGIVGKIFVMVGSKVSKGEPLLHIYNNDFFRMTVKMKADQIKLIRRNQKVVHPGGHYNIEGRVESVDRKNALVDIIFRNDNFLKEELNNLHLEINCGKVKGDFILSSAFTKNKIIAYIDDESTFEIFAIGVSDSLSLISPGLPHLSKLSVVSHNN